MKAKFKRTRTADGLALSFGKMYDVLDVKAGKGLRNIVEIKIENDLGVERWYKANKFILFAEAIAYARGKIAAEAAEKVAQSATPNGRELIMQIDALAPPTARQMFEDGKAVAAGMAAGIGLNYGA